MHQNNQREMLSVKRLLSSIFLVCALVMSSVVVNAATEEPQKKLTKKQLEKRQQEINEGIIEAGKKGPQAVDDFLKSQGFEEADMIVPVEPMSSNGNATVDTLKGYKDKFSGTYLVSGWWHWKDLAYVDSDAGAMDGVALALSNQSDFSKASGFVFASNPANIAVYDQNGKYYSDAGGPAKISGSGVAYTFQDEWLPGGIFVGYSGQVWFQLTTPPTKTNLYITMDYEHTYSASTLSSFGINYPTGSPPTITMSWTSVPKNWVRSNLVQLNGWPQN